MSDSVPLIFRKERKRFFLAVGVAVGLAALASVAFFFLPEAEAEEQAPTVELSEEQKTSGSAFAVSFLEAAGNFGLSDASAAAEGFTGLSAILSANGGQFNNPSLGLSRYELFTRLQETVLDPRGEISQDATTLGLLQNFTPDWSGQLVKYTLSNVQVTPGAAELIDGVFVANFQTSFTIRIDLWINESEFGATERQWNRYSIESFETVTLRLSEQNNMDTQWKVWAIDDLTSYPYALVTWSTPDWRIDAPNKNQLEAVSR